MLTDARPRRGQSQLLGNGLRHDHTVTCTLNGTPDNCHCPYSFWHPRAMPRKRVRVAGTQDEDLWDITDVDLADVTAPFVSDWLAELMRREVSLHMQRDAYELVRKITNVWYEQASIPNPVAAVKRPRTIPAQEKRAKDCAITAAQCQL